MTAAWPIAMTTSIAEDYVSKPGFFVFLRDHFKIEPIFRGQGTRDNRTTLWSKAQIDAAILQLELQGGWDLEAKQPIKN